MIFNIFRKHGRRAGFNIDALTFLPAEVLAHLTEVVTLSCLKPSNLATLTWTFAQFRNQSEKRFIQSPDGSLSFLITNDTLGTYSCEAEEGGYKEVIIRYDVQLKRPRNFSPRTHESVSTDESYEDIATEEPTQHVHTNTRTTKDRNNVFTTTFKDTMIPNEEIDGRKVDLTLTSVRDSQYSPEPGDIRVKEKSYYSELVCVSLLLALCICILTLGSLHMWRQGLVSLKRGPLVTPDDNTNKAVEICSLRSPDETECEVKVV